MPTHSSPDNTFPMVKQTTERKNSDSGNPINRRGEAVAGIASQQPRQTSSALFKPTTTKTLIFDCKNENILLFEDLQPTMLEMQPEKSEAMKSNHFHSHPRKEAIRTFTNINANKVGTVGAVLNIFRRKYVRPQSQAKAKFKWHKLTFNPNKKSLADFFEELKKCAERAFGPLVQQMIDSLFYAMLSPHLKRSMNLAYLENGTYDQHTMK